MKTIIVTLIASCVVSLAQTSTSNSDSTSDKNAPLVTTEQLLSAAKSGDTETVKSLLEKGADVNAKGDIGTNIFFHEATALMWASAKGQTDTIKLLLDKGADINAENFIGSTALMWAAGHGDTNVVQLLLDKGADINAKGGFLGGTALTHAVYNGQTDMVKFLLDRGAKNNGDALTAAAQQGQTDIVKLLLDKGADINVKDNGRTALMNLGLIGEQIDPATGLPSKITTDGEIAKIKMFKLLLSRGADINTTNDFGETALMEAAQENDTNVIELLLARKADFNAVDADGETALGIAKRRGKTAVVKLLQQAGATALSASGSSFNTVVASGTNTDSSGYVTNEALLTPFTLTGSTGRIITNAVLVKLTPNKFVYKTPSGEMGILRLDSLSKDLQDKFGYNPTNAAAADEVDRQKRETQLAHDREYQAAEKLAENRKKIESTKMIIEGKILQKIDTGLLVDSAGQRRNDAIKERIVIGDNLSGDIRFLNNGLQVYDGLCLLTDYHNDANLVDGDIVEAAAYPNGEYTYTTVNGSLKTVRQFTCNVNFVSVTPSENELQKMKLARPLEP